MGRLCIVTVYGTAATADSILLALSKAWQLIIPCTSYRQYIVCVITIRRVDKLMIYLW